MSTLWVYGTLVDGQSHPPVILVHGAANSARVWRLWQSELASRGWSSHAVDLRGHGQSEGVDLSETGMTDYVEDVAVLVRQLRRRPILVGWSMGGLVAMMAATACDVMACVGLAPSPPARVRDAAVPIRAGVFGPEEYGIVDYDADRQPMMHDLDRDERLIALHSLGMESRRARDERKAGVIVEKLTCPLLVVTGTEDSQWPRERYLDLHLEHDHITVEGASHWGLVLNRRLLPRLVSDVVEWMQKTERRASSD